MDSLLWNVCWFVIAAAGFLAVWQKDSMEQSPKMGRANKTHSSSNAELYDG